MLNLLRYYICPNWRSHSVFQFSDFRAGVRRLGHEKVVTGSRLLLVFSRKHEKRVRSSIMYEEIVKENFKLGTYHRLFSDQQ